jgi:putative chitinase
VADQAAPFLAKYMKQYGIDTPLRQAHFLAQVGHESGSLNTLVENLNYSADGLRKIFSRYFTTQTLAEQYARKPLEIASRVYASRMGNGDEKSQDGWKYRGRGLIQVTGFSNYSAFKKDTGIDVISNPNYLATIEGAVHSACWFWHKNKLNALAD